MKVAWLGLGRMGAPMTMHVVRAGHDVGVWNRSSGRDSALVTAGARRSESVADAVGGADVVVTMLFGPDAVREVLTEVAVYAPRGALVIDCSTIGPGVAREMAALLAPQGIRFVDAPVAGSVPAATDGTLGVLAGGSPVDYAAAEPLLHLWGDPGRVRHVGPVGTGSAMKLVLNLTLGVAMAGVGEALRLAEDLGLDRDRVLDVLAAGPLGMTVSSKRPMLASGHYEPTNFSLDLMAKDLRLAVEAAHHRLPATGMALETARAGIEAGRGDEDYVALAGHLIAGDAGGNGVYFSVVVDCADPNGLAAFYGALLDLPVVFSAGAFVVLQPVQRGTGVLIFQQVGDERPPGKNRAHIDVHVRDLELATAKAVELGALRGDDVADIGLTWRTMTDPEGNVFCLVPHAVDG